MPRNCLDFVLFDEDLQLSGLHDRTFKRNKSELDFIFTISAAETVSSVCVLTEFKLFARMALRFGKGKGTKDRKTLRPLCTCPFLGQS